MSRASYATLSRSVPLTPEKASFTLVETCVASALYPGVSET